MSRTDERNEKFMKILVGKSEGMRSLWRSRRRREDNIRAHLRVITWEVVHWIQLSHYTDQ